jgi:putative salt-induced outer membrane protein
MKTLTHPALLALALFPTLSCSQVTTKPDGEFRSLWGVAASVSGGNTRATTVTLTGETVRQTDDSKWLSIGRLFYARNEEATTAANFAFTTQYDRDLFNKDYFSVAKIDFLRDRPANIASRVSAYGGLGRHLVRNDQNTWDIFGGFGYTEDRYVAPADVGGQMRERYGRTEGLISENSNHKLTPNTTLRQKFEWYPDLRDEGEFRAVFDTGLSVAMTQSWQLTTGVQYRYNSAPGVELKHYDVLFLTGISLRFD